MLSTKYIIIIPYIETVALLTVIKSRYNNAIQCIR